MFYRTAYSLRDLEIYPLLHKCDYAQDRIRNLMIYRTLQLNRHINVRVLMESVDGTESLRQSFAGVVGTLKNEGCLASSGIAGKDKNGRPYNDWQIASPERIKEILKKRKIRPLRPETLEALRNR